MKITKTHLRQIIKEELEALHERSPTQKDIDKLANVLETHYPKSIPVIAAYLETIDMLNKEYRASDATATDAQKELFGALMDLDGNEQPIMMAVRQIMKGKIK